MPWRPEATISQSAMRDAAGVREMNETAAARQRPAGAVELEAGERQRVGAVGRDQRRAAREHEPGGAAHADELRSGRQVQSRRRDRRRAPSASGTRAPAAWSMAACSARRLVVGAAGAQAEMSGVDAGGRARRRHRAARAGGWATAAAAAAETASRRRRVMAIGRSPSSPTPSSSGPVRAVPEWDAVIGRERRHARIARRPARR